MSYVVLARKWRPQLFSDVLGQEHVTRTLTNAINASRIAHAFLFSGPRGVGKTSAARILAKALCCEEAGKPTPTPCGKCRQCVEITEGRSTDVFEIDAASHTGVDNVREIIDNVRYLPSSARFKIYVIDEVHMLSTGAFNALLKTLEEPPAHVKFILATTDVHKVPVTILSRCQRYDFRRIPLTEIAARLSAILVKEGIDHDPSALTLVAREGEGSMRDAQSLLEQVLAFADGRRLDGPLVRESLGVVDGALIARTFDALLGRQPGVLIEVASEVHERGLDLKRFADALVEESRDLLVAKLVPDPARALDRPSDEVAALVERGKKMDVVGLERLFERLCKIVEEVGRSPHPRFALEIGLASLAAEPERVPLEDLLAKLSDVERQITATAPAPSSPVRRSNDWQRSKAPPSQYAVRARPEPRVAAPRTAAPKSDDGSGTGSPDHRSAGETSDDEPAPERAVVVEARGPELAPSAPIPAPTSASTVAYGDDDDDDAGFEEPPHPADAGSAYAPSASFVDEEPPPIGDAMAPSGRGAATPSPAMPARGPDATLEAFKGFVDLLKKKRPSLAATLVQVRPLVFGRGAVELGCETAFDEAKLKDPETRAYLEAQLAEYLGVKTSLQVSRTGRLAPAAPGTPSRGDAPATLNEVEDETRAAKRNEKGSAARNRPAVKAVAEELGATIARIRVIDEGS